MPGVRMIPIKNEDETVVGQRFAPSNEFLRHLDNNYESTVRGDGKTVRLNRKLVANGYYEERGIETPSLPPLSRQSQLPEPPKTPEQLKRKDK